MGMMVASVFQPDAIPFDQEELYNAAHARLLQLGHWENWLDLQYRGHCGGCTQHALLGAALFTLFGHTLFAWKLIPVLYIGLMAYAGARILRRYFGAVAAIAWGALLCLPSPTFLELSMTAWGNHVEAGVAAVVSLHVALRLRDQPTNKHACLLGMVLAWALWIGFSSVFLVPAMLPILWRRVDSRRLGLLFISATPVLLLWAYQHAFAISGPFETIYYAGETTPRLSRVPEKLWSLIAPRQLTALFGDASMRHVGWTVALSVMVSAWISRHHPASRAFLWAMGAFLSVYCTVRFTVWTPPAPEIAPPGSMRYAAPVYGLVWLTIAGAAGLAWQRRRRWLTVILIAPSLTAGLTARSAHLTGHFPDVSVLEMAAPDFLYARDQAAYTLTLDEHQASKTNEVDGRAFHDFGVGWHIARETLDQNPTAVLSPPKLTTRASLEGIGAALLSEIDGDERGGLRTLDAMSARMDGFSSESRVRVLSEAARRRDWTGPYRQGHSSAKLSEFQSSIKLLSVEAQRAVTEDLGRRWAADLTRWRKPTPFTAPSTGALAYPESFVQGYAEVIGRRLGDPALPVPLLFQDHLEAWQAGLVYGHRLQWLNRSR